MYTTADLVAATKALKPKLDTSIGWPLAAIKAIEGKGIRHKPDVERRKKDVMEVLYADGTIPKRRRHT